jgi:hypothetical protein
VLSRSKAAIWAALSDGFGGGTRPDEPEPDHEHDEEHRSASGAQQRDPPVHGPSIPGRSAGDHHPEQGCGHRGEQAR